MDHRDPSLWRRLPGPGDAVPSGQADGERARARHHGLRQIRRLSNWTAAGLVAATAVEPLMQLHQELQRCFGQDLVGAGYSRFFGKDSGALEHTAHCSGGSTQIE